MSVMTPGGWSTPGNYRGQPIKIEQADPAMQRQAVIDQLAPPTAGATARGTGATAPAAPIGAPTTGGASAFQRGGAVKQLPGANTAGLAGTGVGIGAQVAGNVARGAGQNAARQGVNQVASQVGSPVSASRGLTSFGGGAAGAATTAGIGLATGLIADKLRVKEETPTFGGEHGALTDEYGRRFEGTGGGVASNAARYAGYGSAAGPIGMGVGALAGAIIGGATKNAPSAFTDFRVEDAAEAISKAYEQYLGRPASEDEITNQLVGQGWDPQGGDRWVGEKNLTGKGGVLDQIRDSPEGQAFRATGKPATARAAVVDQLGTAAASGADVPGSAPAPPGAGASTGAAPDPSGWNTDGYAAPAYVPPGSGPVPNGWDQTKWNDPNHQTPKYGVGRILSNFPPTVDGLKAAMADIEKAYPGTTFNGKDRINIPGVGEVDVLEGASQGGKAWRWGADDGGGGGGGAVPTAGDEGLVSRLDTGRGDLLADLQAAIERITRGEAPRGELMQQLGGANG